VISAEIRAEMRRLVLVESWRIETVARRFGVHHSVVRRALRDDVPQVPTRPPSALDPFKPFIIQRLTQWPELTASRLFDEVRARGYQRSIAQLRRYVAQVRTPRSRKVYLRVEVMPGDQAQVDWGSFGQLRIGSSLRPLSVFSMVLSWSRALFLDFSLDQRMDTFLRMHRRALEFFAGVPKKVLYDNLKSVVLHHVGATVQFNPQFLHFAGHYLFEPVAAPVRYPEAKGRVEASIKFIRHAFFYGRTFASLDDLRAQAARWRDETANQRLHATTRERPADRLLVERSRLRPLPARPFDTDLVLFPIIINKEARVRLDTNSYSVPSEPNLVGKTAELRADDKTVRITVDGQIVAEHARSWDRHQHIEKREHREKLIERRPGAHGTTRRDRVAQLSPECRLYLHEVARRKINLQNEVRMLLRLIERYGETEVAQAMAQALTHKSFGARYVRTLIDQARFARGLGEPPEPIVTGNAAADALVVEPHDLESYDALFKKRKASDPDA
jgi:transposase